jgi:hypothetical protein
MQRVLWLQAWKKESRTDIYYTPIDGEVFQIQHSSSYTVLSVDYKKATDINRTEVLNALGSYGIP